RQSSRRKSASVFRTSTRARTRSPLTTISTTVSRMGRLRDRFRERPRDEYGTDASTDGAGGMDVVGRVEVVHRERSDLPDVELVGPAGEHRLQRGGGLQRGRAHAEQPQSGLVHLPVVVEANAARDTGDGEVPGPAGQLLDREAGAPAPDRELHGLDDLVR